MNESRLFLVVLSFLNLFDLKSTPLFSLESLDCSRSNVIGGTVGIRPVGKNGLRLEKESIEDKDIFHNTSHGGSGATLAPGCAKEIVRIYEKNQITPEKKVCVLGAGHIGLMTALELDAQEYDVTIIANQFPSRKYIFDVNNPPITSLVYGGIWLPFGIKVPNKELFDRILIDSYRFYENAIHKKSYQGLCFRDSYALPTRDFSLMPEGLMDKPFACQVEFGNKRYFPALKYSTVAMDADLLVNDLYDQALKKGINFINREFQTVDEIQSLKFKTIFNCTGYGSRYLFKDENIRPASGKLVYLKQNPKVNYFLYSHSDQYSFSIYPLHDKIAIGHTYVEEDEILDINDQDIEHIRANAEDFFKDKIR